MGATASYSPSMHRFTALHASPLSLSEKVLPMLHIAQTRSVALVPGTDMPSPSGHLLHGEQAVRPAVAVNCPGVHALHTRLLDSVASARVYSPTAHKGRTLIHLLRSSIGENVDPASQGAHMLSETALPAKDSP